MRSTRWCGCCKKTGLLPPATTLLPAPGPPPLTTPRPSPRTPQACLRAIAGVAGLRDASSGLSASQAGALQAQGLEPPSLDLLSSLDVQLPAAAINLLFALAARSQAARRWLVSHEGAELLQAGLGMCTPPHLRCSCHTTNGRREQGRCGAPNRNA